MDPRPDRAGSCQGSQFGGSVGLSQWRRFASAVASMRWDRHHVWPVCSPRPLWCSGVVIGLAGSLTMAAAATAFLVGCPEGDYVRRAGL